MNPMNFSHFLLRHRRRAIPLFLGLFTLTLEAMAALPLPDLDLRLKGVWPPYGRASAEAIVASHDHAYLAAGEGGLLVFDVSTPAQPQFVTALSLPGFAAGLALSGEHLLVANRGDAFYGGGVFNGFHVIDVHDPAQPRVVTRVALPGSAFDVAISGTRVVVLDGGTYDSPDNRRLGTGIEVFDLEDPRQPRRLGRIDAVGGQDVGSLAASDGIACFIDGSGLAVIDLSPDEGPRRVGQYPYIGGWDATVTLNDRHAFLADDHLLTVLDLRDPARPVLISESWGDESFGPGLLVAGHYAYTGTAVWDVSDLRHPTQVGRLEYLGPPGPQDYVSTARSAWMARVGDTLLRIGAVSGGWGGPKANILRIIDVSNPKDSRTLTTFAIGADVREVALSGSLAWVANGVAGLQIVDVSNPERPHRLADFLDFGVVSRVITAGTNVFLLGNGVVYVLDISDPRKPRSRGVYTSEGWTDDISIAGDRAFVFKRFIRGGGLSEWWVLEVLDLSNPDAPRRLSQYDVNWPWLSPAYPQFRYTPDAAEGWVIHDVSDMGNPVRIGSYRAMVEALGGILIGDQIYTSGGEVFDVLDPANPRRAREGYPAIQARSGNLGCGVDQSDYGRVLLQCYDLSDPAAPRLIGRYAAGGGINAVKLRGTDAFVAAGAAGLQIVDLSRPSNLLPKEASSLPSGGSAWDVAVSGTYAYVTVGEAGLFILNISRPAEPILIGAIETDGVAVEVAVSANYAYVADGYAGLQVVDVGDPTRPRRVGTLGIEGPAYHVAVADEHVLVAGEYGVHVIEVRDPANPRSVAKYETQNPVANLAVSGSYVFVADRGGRDLVHGGRVAGGLEVIDLVEPANPRRIARFPTKGPATTLSLSGGILIVGDHGLWSGYGYEGAGLTVVDVSTPASPQLLGGYPLDDTNRGFPGSVVLSGHHAYLNSVDGLHVIDISDPTNPRRINRTLWLGDPPGRLAVSGGHLFAVAGGALKTVDIVEPSESKWLGGYSTWGPVHPLNLTSVVPAGRFAVSPSGDGLQILDLSNPLQPQRLGGYVSQSRIADVGVSGRFAYVAERGGEIGSESVASRLSVVDLGDPIHPRKVGALELDGPALGVAVSGTTALVAAGARGLIAVNITDPTHPVETGRFDTGGSANDVVLVGSYALVAAAWAGFQVIDVSQPSQLRRVAGHPAEADRIEVTGNLAYVWYEAGLLVFNVTDPARPQLTSRIALTPGSARSAVIFNDYVFVVNESGLVLLDLKDPSQPRRIAGNSAIDPWYSPFRFSEGTLFVHDNGNGVVTFSVPPFFRSISQSDGQVQLEWESWGHARLQRATRTDSTEWQDVPGAESLRSLVLPSDAADAFFRLHD